jgi:hypothetical protein
VEIFWSLDAGARRIAIGTLATPPKVLGLHALGTFGPLSLCGMLSARFSLSGTAGGIHGNFSAGIRVGFLVGSSPAPARVLVSERAAAHSPASAGVIRVNIRVKGVGLFGMLGHFLAEGPRIAGLLLGFLLQPRGLNLCLFRVGAGSARPGFLLTCVEFHRLCFPAYFGGFLAVCLVPLLLHCPAPTACHQEHDEKNHYNKANNNPNPGCNVQATHLFPFVPSGQTAGLAGTSDPLIRSLV